MAVKRPFGYRMIRAQLKRLHSPGVQNLAAYMPDIGDRFGFLLQVLAGPEDSEGEESFDVLVCTPEWLKQGQGHDSMIIGRHYLIVFEYDYERLHSFISRYCADCSGATWREIAEKLGRLGKWEFEDYRSFGS